MSLRWIAAIAASLALAGNALAQDAADPGEIERRIEQLRPERVPEAPPGVARPAPTPAEAAPEDLSFVLTGVIFEGATVFDAAALGPLYADFLATSVGRQELEEIAARITKRYVDGGYFLSRAVIPPQDVQGGVLRVRVVEGYIDKVRFQGALVQEDLLDGYREEFTRQRPAELDAMERTILLINKLPGFAVQDVQAMAVGTEGAHELLLSLTYGSTSVSLYLDNRGTPEVGHSQAWTNVAFNSILGLGEQIQLSVATVPEDTSELAYGEIAARQPIGTGGTEFGVSLAASSIDAGGDLAVQDTESRGLTVKTDLSHPIVLSRRQELNFRASFEARNISEDRFRISTIDDRVRVVRAQVQYAAQDALDGTNLIAVEASQGLGILDASDAGDPGDANRSRADADGSFTKFQLDVVRLQQVWGPISLRLAGRGQVAVDPLLSSEEFLLGGAQFGRAYDFGEISGEDGVAGSVELRVGRKTNLGILSRYEFYGFFDRGALWDRNSAPGMGHQTLSSAGGGLRLDLAESLSASAEAAKPLDRDVESTGNRDVRFFFSLSAQF